MRLPAEIRATLPPFAHGAPDDQFVAISRAAPGGFAGYFVDNGRQVLTFTDTATANAHRAEIQDVFNANIPKYGSAPNVATAEIRGARWTFAELGEWWQYILANLNVRGISTIDIDEKANTIAFGVVDEDSRAQLEAKLASLSVSCNLVTTIIQGYATAVNRESTATP
jgi:hypothetical protein